MTTFNSDPKRRALGRGLDALLPPRPAPPAPQVEAAPAASTGTPLEVSVDSIEPNPFQTRTTFDEGKLEELARSIAASGVVQPIVVRLLPPADGKVRYQLVAGERRLIASRRAGKRTVPAIVRTVSDEQAMEMTIVENLQRADLNPMEQARAFQRLTTDFRMTQEQIATRTGKERASVANFLRLLKLPADVQSLVESGELSFGHARSLLALGSAADIAAGASKVVALGLSVRQTEAYVQALMHPESKQAGPKQVIEPRDPNVQEAQDHLQRSLGLRVKIEDKKGKGRVIIEYSGLDEFDAIVAALDRPSR